jgi:trehalose utilization protein
MKRGNQRQSSTDLFIAYGQGFDDVDKRVVRFFEGLGLIIIFATATISPYFKLLYGSHFYAIIISI